VRPARVFPKGCLWQENLAESVKGRLRLRFEKKKGKLLGAGYWVLGETCQGFPERMPVAGKPGRVCEGKAEIEV